jgi:hypothetical protein
MTRSRYIKTQRHKLPRHKRSQRLEGSFEDSGRWIRCWNCGFINDLSKLSLTGESGISVRDFSYENQDLADSGDPNNITLTLDQLDMEGVVLENGPDGSAVTDYYTPRIPVAVRGCAFCGCGNLP